MSLLPTVFGSVVIIIAIIVYKFVWAPKHQKKTCMTKIRRIGKKLLPKNVSPLKEKVISNGNKSKPTSIHNSKKQHKNNGMISKRKRRKSKSPKKKWKFKFLSNFEANKKPKKKSKGKSKANNATTEQKNEPPNSPLKSPSIQSPSLESPMTPLSPLNSLDVQQEILNSFETNKDCIDEMNSEKKVNSLASELGTPQQKTRRKRRRKHVHRSGGGKSKHKKKDEECMENSSSDNNNKEEEIENKCMENEEIKFDDNNSTNGGYTIRTDPRDWQLIIDDEMTNSYARYLPNKFQQNTLDEWFNMVYNNAEWDSIALLPRKVAWYTNCNCKYRYGTNVVCNPKPFPEWLNNLTNMVMMVIGLDISKYPNSCNINLYEHGYHKVGWHSDDEQLFGGLNEINEGCMIFSFSLGISRQFDIKVKSEYTNHNLTSVELNAGDVITMENMFQKYYVHRIPPAFDSNMANKPRINLTWRTIINHSKYDQCLL